MNGYFNPLRRKAACVTLGLACVFAAGWVRSLIAADRFSFFDVDFLSEDGWVMRCVTTFTTEQVGSQFGTTAIETPVWSIPYWSIVVPLTLLAAWLLLSKPRVKSAR